MVELGTIYVPAPLLCYKNPVLFQTNRVISFSWVELLRLELIQASRMAYPALPAS